MTDPEVVSMMLSLGLGGGKAAEEGAGVAKGLLRGACSFSGSFVRGCSNPRSLACRKFRFRLS